MEFVKGDLILSSNIDFLTNKPVKQEWYIVDYMSECKSAVYCRNKAENTWMMLFTDEIVSYIRKL